MCNHENKVMTNDGWFCTDCKEFVPKIIFKAIEPKEDKPKTTKKKTTKKVSKSTTEK